MMKNGMRTALLEPLGERPFIEKVAHQEDLGGHFGLRQQIALGRRHVDAVGLGVKRNGGDGQGVDLGGSDGGGARLGRGNRSQA